MRNLSATIRLATLVIGLTAISIRAAEITYSKTFRLRPGETAFALELSRFDPTVHPTTPNLDAVKITLQATNSGGMTFYEEVGLAGPASGTVGNARVMATPTTSGLLMPAVTTLSLSGSVDNVPAHGSASTSVQSTASSLVSDTGGSTLLAYSGSGSVAYDIDFTALYEQLVTTIPVTTTGILCNDVVTGAITVTYTASQSPTAVVMQSFNASWAAPGRVTVTWQTGVESNLVGFRLERKPAGGEWTEVSSGMIPAVGDNLPHSYRFDDPHAPAAEPLTYRLLAVDRSGGVTVAAETVVQVGVTSSIAVTGAGIQVDVHGVANTKVLIEETRDIARGPWVEAGALMLDADGTGTLILTFSSAESARFYRVVQE